MGPKNEWKMKRESGLGRGVWALPDLEGARGSGSVNAYVCCKYLIPGKATGTLSICSGRTWVAVKELNLSH